MSITVSSTALDTAWSEQSVVAFTAGTLSDINDMVVEVESKLRRGTLGPTTTPTSQEVQRWLIRAKQELAETKNYTWRRRYAYADTTAGTYRYALPPDYAGGPISIRDLSNNRELDLWPDHLFAAKFPDPSEEPFNEPMAACVKDRELWLVPPPDGVYRIEMEYSRSGDDVTSTDFSWLPEIERFRCCDFAVAQAFKSLHMWEVAALYSQDWNQGVAKARVADGKRKWARIGYQAASWLQLSAARRHQSTPED